MILRFAALLLLAALAAYGAGTLVPARWLTSPAERAGMRIAAGLALYATLFFALGAFGALRRAELAVAAAAGIAAAAWDLRRLSPRLPARPAAAAALAAALAGAFVLGLYPPTAFDETLYHLPTVGAFAATGRMPFLASLRVPVFPNAAEALEVPLLLFGGDAATHVVFLLATIATLLLVFAALREAGEGAAWLGAAIFLSSPIVVHLASSGYVEPALTLFCFGAYAALGRGEDARGGRLLLAAVLAGAAASVKYLGLPWVAGGAGAAALLSPRGRRLRAAAVFIAVSAAVLAPWYLRVFRATGNPVFPFLPALFGHSAWDPVGLSHPGGLGRAAADLLRLPWDAIFARARVNRQPPFSPWLLLASPLLAGFAVRDRRARASLAVCLGWGFLWLALPRDSRYLTVVLPILSVETARAAAEAARLRGRRLPAWLAAVAVLPALAYAGWRIARQGPVPLDAAGRERYLSRSVAAHRAVAFLNRTAPNATVFVCGGEQLRWYYRGTMIGDAAGIARYDRILAATDGPELARRLDALGARWILRVRAACPAPVLDRADLPFRAVYSDDAAEVEERVP